VSAVAVKKKTMVSNSGTPLRRPREDHRRFRKFLKTLEGKTWQEALILGEAEYRSLGAHQKRYCVRLLKLISFLRYPKKQRPKEYRPVLVTMRDLPDLLVEKLAEIFWQPKPQSYSW
jgi:hypothetical protein